MSSPPPEPARRSRPKGVGSLSNTMAFVLGVPLGLGLLAAGRLPVFADTDVPRYLSHPVEHVSVILFACAFAALLTKLVAYWNERAAFFFRWLPPQGEPVPVGDATPMLDEVDAKPWRARNTFLGRRVRGVLEFIENRQSAADLDDHLRGLTDNDDIALEGSYSLIRFITWAIPILGFLGTVLGITGAISGVNPEVLEKNLNAVTDGLATAFDTTAVALALTMVVMFLSFVTEGLERGLLDRVNNYADVQLAHRFERGAGPDGSGLAGELRRNAQVLVQAMEQVVLRQVSLWTQSLEEAQTRWLQTGQEQQRRVAAGLADALEQTAAAHEQRLARQEEATAQVAAAVVGQMQQLTVAVRDGTLGQQQALAQLMDRMTAHTEVLTQLAASGSQLVQLQQALDQNLEALAGSGAFEQAVASLTAAVHMLTAKSAAAQVSQGNRLARPGTAA